MHCGWWDGGEGCVEVLRVLRVLWRRVGGVEDVGAVGGRRLARGDAATCLGPGDDPYE